MKGKSTIINFFIDGFVFANKNFDLFLYDSFMIVLISILDLFPHSLFKTLFSLIIFQLSFGYFFSLPALLVMRQNKAHLRVKEIIAIIIENAKKLIRPAVLLAIVFVGLIIIFTIAIFIIKQPQKIKPNLIQQSTDYLIIFISLTAPVMIFTAIFFALGKMDFFTALAKAIIYCIKNMSFVILIIIITISCNILRINIGFKNAIFSFIITLVFKYFFYYISVVSLLYYQNKLK